MSSRYKGTVYKGTIKILHYGGKPMETRHRSSQELDKLIQRLSEEAKQVYVTYPRDQWGQIALRGIRIDIEDTEEF